MTDPLGLVGGASGVGPLNPGQPAAGKTSAAGFKDLLMQNIDQVNELQRDATQAIEDLQTGRRDDVESVLLATAKADTAFRLLQQVRNKVFDAYREIQQLRV
ncbi:MAG TPA: flagellar hook-basal body complex protein FliE [Phycisphaerales bacterium]|nr:flagellar hook-basal body complex protein FliE [Phycisphaerales bacterium]